MSQAIQLISKLENAGVLFFGAEEVMNGTITVGQLVAFTMFASRASQSPFPGNFSLPDSRRSARG